MLEGVLGHAASSTRVWMITPTCEITRLRRRRDMKDGRCRGAVVRLSARHLVIVVDPLVGEDPTCALLHSFDFEHTFCP